MESSDDELELIDYIEELVRNFDNNALEKMIGVEDDEDDEEEYDDDDLIDDINLLQSYPKFANSLFTSFKYFIQTVGPLQYKMFCFVTKQNKKPKIPKYVNFNGKLFPIHYEFTIEKHNDDNGCDNNKLKTITALFQLKFVVPGENANKIVCKINIFKFLLK